MGMGTVLVIGAAADWFSVLAETLRGSDVQLLRAEGAEEEPLGPAAREADLLLVAGSDAVDVGGVRLGGAPDAPSPGWRLLTRPGAAAFPELPTAGLFVGGCDVGAREVGERIRAWLERDRLLECQREVVANLTEASRTLEVDREILRTELSVTGQRLQRMNVELRQRVKELSRLNAELQRLKELNANIIEALHEGLIASDENGRVSHWSDGAADLLGWSREEVLGEPIVHFLRATEADSSILLDVLERSEGRRSLRVTLLSKTQEPRLIELGVSPLGAGGERLRGMVLLLTDLAKQQRTEEQVRRRERLASLGELSAGVAHEIRNPLAGIGTTAELLRSRVPPDSPEVEFVDVILEEVGRLDKIIADLLTFARPAKPRMVRGDIHRNLDRMLFLLRRQIGRRRIQVVRRYDRSLPPVEVDPDQTLQLFLNVGLNAIEAMGNGGTLTVITQEGSSPESGGATEGAERWLRVMVQDTGPGVPPEIRDKVFNPFFTTKGKGSGLGLAISQRILEEHGGSIYLESAPPAPTTVVIDLPMSPAPSVRDGQTQLFASPVETEPTVELHGGKP